MDVFMAMLYFVPVVGVMYSTLRMFWFICSFFSFFPPLSSFYYFCGSIRFTCHISRQVCINSIHGNPFITITFMDLFSQFTCSEKDITRVEIYGVRVDIVERVTYAPPRSDGCKLAGQFKFSPNNNIIVVVVVLLSSCCVIASLHLIYNIKYQISLV